MEQQHRGRPRNDALGQQIAALASRGQTRVQIASELGISRQRVRSLAYRHGIRFPPLATEAKNMANEKPFKLDMPFEEALRVQTNPNEDRDERERIAKKEEEVEQFVRKREDSIRRGARRARKRFQS